MPRVACRASVRSAVMCGGAIAACLLAGCTRFVDRRSEVDAYWANAREEVYKSALEIMAQHQAELQRGIRYDKLIRGDPARRTVALTFDDGPHPDYTPQLLALLKQHNIKATFFVVGEMAEKYPDLIKAEVADGHAIGNHTYHHVDLTRIPNVDVVTEIQACGDVLKRITGQEPHLFRPPGGDYDRKVAEAAEALGYTMVLWTDDPGDYARPGDATIETRTLRAVKPGGIILLHDGVQQTIDVLPRIIDLIEGKGLRFVTVDEMLRSARP
jgi:peptidoglycan/xylan/chitin deacetylase (PgdA/CDA1 family)